MKIVNFVGYSGSGKTTLIEQLIEIFTQAGLNVSAIKHTHHGIQTDKPGKDSFRFTQAGARQVIINCGERWALMVETGGKPASLKELVDRLGPCDLVLVEGFKSENFAGLRMEVWREGVKAASPICMSDPMIQAVISDKPVGDGSVAVLDIDDPKGIASWIADKLSIEMRF